MFSYDDGQTITRALTRLVRAKSPALHASIFIGSRPEMVRMRISLDGVAPQSHRSDDSAVLSAVQITVWVTDSTLALFIARTINIWDKAIDDAWGKAAQLIGDQTAAARAARALSLMNPNGDR